MKEKIYTIPINEAFETESFCPFCSIFNRLDKEAVTYTVGPAMMEPDFRIITNQNGFCQRHMAELCSKSKALPLSLVFKTHLDNISEMMELSTDESKRRKKMKERQEFTKNLEEVASSCAVCDRINNTFDRYVETFIYMLRKESDFFDKVMKSNGFCMEHFSKIATSAKDNMSDSEYEKLFMPIVAMQKKRIDEYRAYVKNFSDSFDYRNVGKQIDAPQDVLLKTGYLLNGTFDPKPKKLDDI